MNNGKFIRILKKSLASLDEISRNDIVREIESYAAESEGETRLFDHFGSPETLALQYLEKEEIPITKRQEISNLIKKGVFWFGAIILIIIIGIAILIWQFSSDAFDYANESAEELGLQNGRWQTTQWTQDVELDIKKSQVAIYWHEEDHIRWRCHGNGLEKMADARFNIYKANCLVFLPTTKASILVNQAQIVIVRPQFDIMISAHDAKLRIAENGNRYRYNLNVSHSDVENLQSDDTAPITISITSIESQISYYSYH